MTARRIALWAGGIVVGLVVLLGLVLVGLNTDPGRRFIVNQINAFETVSGLQVRVGRIEGSIFGKLKIHDLRLADPKGVFFAAPEAEMDWRPLAYFGNHIDGRALDIPSAHLWRLPALKASGDPNAP